MTLALLKRSSALTAALAGGQVLDVDAGLGGCATTRLRAAAAGTGRLRLQRDRRGHESGTYQDAAHGDAPPRGGMVAGSGGSIGGFAPGSPGSGVLGFWGSRGTTMSTPSPMAAPRPAVHIDGALHQRLTADLLALTVEESTMAPARCTARFDNVGAARDGGISYKYFGLADLDFGRRVTVWQGQPPGTLFRLFDGRIDVIDATFPDSPDRSCASGRRTRLPPSGRCGARGCSSRWRMSRSSR